MSTGPTTGRAALAARQRGVLDDLLAGRVPEGFDPRGARLTTLVLHRKRSAAALAACPEVAALPQWRERFHTWAAASPAAGCAHDDVRRFATSLRAQEPGWVRLHEAYAGRRGIAWVRLEGRRELVVRIRDRVHRVTWAPRRRGATLQQFRQHPFRQRQFKQQQFKQQQDLEGSS